MRQAILAVALAGLLTGCAGGDSAGGTSAGGGVSAAGPPVEKVGRAFYPRAEADDYWEVIPLAGLDSHFLIHLHPRIRTPAEGPWTFTFLDPDGGVFFVERGMRVDTATGQFTFLCRSEEFRPGDWWVEMTLDEGGMTAGAEKRRFCFRVVPSA